MKVFTHRYSFPSARILATALGCGVTSRPEKLNKDDVVVRYGRSDYIPNKCIGNSAKFIEIAANKEAFSRATRDYIWTPIFYKTVPTQFPILVRESLGLSGGRGIHVVKTIEEFNEVWNSSYYWTPYVHTTSEFRAHCVKTETGWVAHRLFKKQKVDGTPEEEYPIRNLHRGYHFSLRNDITPGIAKAISKFDACPYFESGMFCAVDLAWCPEENAYFIFEINTAPGMNENTATMLASFLKED